MQVSFFSGLELVGSGGTCKYQWIGYLLIQYWRKEIILARFTFVLNLLRFFLFQSFLIEYIVVTQFITRTFYKINVLGNNTMLCTNHGGMLGMGGLKDACKATRRITRSYIQLLIIFQIPCCLILEICSYIRHFQDSLTFFTLI